MKKTFSSRYTKLKSAIFVQYVFCAFAILNSILSNIHEIQAAEWVKQ